MKLYELTAQHRELSAIDLDSDDIALAIADTMEGIEGEFHDKAISLLTVVKNLEGDTTAIDTEIKRLQSRKKSIENTKNSMKEYLRTNMEATGIKKIECPLFTISLAAGRDVVQIDDEEKIPADYLNIKTIVAPMKAEILKALKDGEVIPGCSIVKSKASLSVK